MTIEQFHLIHKLEKAVAKLSFDEKLDEAAPLSKIVEYLHDDEYSIAYLEGEALGVNRAVLDAIRRLFDVRW